MHIPDNSQDIISEDDDIKTIVYKIYCFLSIICDINIVVLNKSFHQEQIELLITLNKFKCAFNSNTKFILEKFSKNKPSSNDMNEYRSDSECDDDLDIDFDDDFDECIFTNDEVNKIKPKSKLELRNIILINIAEITQDLMVKKDIHLIGSLWFQFTNQKNKNNNFYFDTQLINVNNPITYRGLNNSITNFSISTQTNYNEALE